MKHLVPLVAVMLICFSGARAHAQYIFSDANGDSLCNSQDIVVGDPPVDVYLDTAHDASGAPVACASGEELSLRWYEIIFRGQGDRHGGYVDFGAWTNAVEGFTVNLGESRGGSDFRVGFASSNPVGFHPPGLYKLGTLTVTMTGCTRLEFATSSPLSGTFVTGFYSQCPGADGEYLVKLGTDFYDNCVVGPGICSSTEETTTTWGKIKMTYR